MQTGNFLKENIKSCKVVEGVTVLNEWAEFQQLNVLSVKVCYALMIELNRKDFYRIFVFKDILFLTSILLLSVCLSSCSPSWAKKLRFFGNRWVWCSRESAHAHRSVGELNFWYIFSLLMHAFQKMFLFSFLNSAECSGKHEIFLRFSFYHAQMHSVH